MNVKQYQFIIFLEKKKTIYCSAHKKDGMVNVKSKTCIYEGCKIIPAFNNFGEKIQSIVQHIKR